MRALLAGGTTAALCLFLAYLYLTGGGVALAFGQPEDPVVFGMTFRAQPTEETQAVVVVPASTYDYQAPPSISRERYELIYVEQGSPAAPEAGAIYDLLVSYGLDPAVHAAQAMHETGLGTAGVGAPQWKNMHGVQCHAGDGRISDTSVPWGNGCAGVYGSYTEAVDAWARLILREYVGVGLTTPALAVPKYAPVGADGNNPPAYIADMERHIDQWRQ